MLLGIVIRNYDLKCEFLIKALKYFVCQWRILMVWISIFKHKQIKNLQNNLETFRLFHLFYPFECIQIWVLFILSIVHSSFTFKSIKRKTFSRETWKKTFFGSVGGKVFLLFHQKVLSFVNAQTTHFHIDSLI